MSGSSVFLVSVLSMSVCFMSSCGLLKNSASAISLKAQKLKDDGEGNFDVNEGNSGGRALSSLGNVSPRVTVGQLPDEDDIEWAPEDPNVPIANLEKLWSKPVKESWYTSYKEAIKASRQSGKPLLIWFTNSASSPVCKVLSSELLSRSVFDKWAEENVIRVRIDSFIQDDDEVRRERKEKYVDDLKKRYKVLGAPVVVMVSARGSVFGKYVGYKSGDPGYYFGKLKSSHRVASDDYAKWRNELEAKGYRMWHDQRGRSLFAKLKRYSKGRLLLVEPDGSRSQTTESKLSKEDRVWIANKKRERNVR